MKAISLDIETLDTKTTGVVLSIGACVVDNGKILSDTFHERLSIQEQLDVGRTISESTLRFWMTQNDSVRYSAMGEEGRSALSVFDQLHTWWMKHDAPSVYVKGPQFDAAFVDSVADTFGLEHPIFFRKWRDLRTLEEIMEWAGEGRKLMMLKELTAKPGQMHDALADAIMQGEVIGLTMTTAAHGRAPDGPVKLGA